LSDRFRNYGNMPPPAPYEPPTGPSPYSDFRQHPSQSMAPSGYPPGMANPYESHPAPQQWPSAHGQFGNIPSRPESSRSSHRPQSMRPVIPPNVQMHPTQWDGLFVRTRHGDSQHFPQQAEQGLHMLASQSSGHALLQSISDAPMPDPNFGYKVAIQPAPSTKHQGLFRRSRHYDGTNVTKPIDQRASSNGTGSASAVSWNPQSTQTPHGPQPPFIGLGHELIHAHHNLYGTSNVDDVSDDEDQATGLGDHSSDPITENRLRAEHDVKLRRRY
jgi:hypothetical protein